MIMLATVSACDRGPTDDRGASVHLVSFEVDEGPVENGKQLKMKFTELERVGDVSRVAVKFTSGGSVSSIMVQVRGQCMIAQQRGAKYFWKLGDTRNEGDLWVSEVQFGNHRGIHATATSLDDCKLMGLIK
jgi:hypothetical protein